MNFGSSSSSSFTFDGNEVVVDAIFASTLSVWGFQFSVASDVEEELASEDYYIQIYNESNRNAPVQVSLSDMTAREGYLLLPRATHLEENEEIDGIIAAGQPFFARIIPPYSNLLIDELSFIAGMSIGVDTGYNDTSTSPVGAGMNFGSSVSSSFIFNGSEVVVDAIFSSALIDWGFHFSVASDIEEELASEGYYIQIYNEFTRNAPVQVSLSDMVVRDGYLLLLRATHLEENEEIDRVLATRQPFFAKIIPPGILPNELSFIAGMSIGVDTGYNDASTSPVGAGMSFGSSVSSSFIFNGSEVVVDAIFSSTLIDWGFHFSVASDIEEELAIEKELASEGYYIQIYNESGRNAPVQVSLSDMVVRNGYLLLRRQTHSGKNEEIDRVIATGQPFFARIVPPCSSIHVTDCSALVGLYDATGGDSWTNNSGWLDGGDPDGWEGVQVLNNRVTEIDLMGNNLTGALPSSIGDFTNLTHLNLGDNSLSGELPTEIGELVNLTSLYLDNNNFSGGLPTEIRDLADLELLWIHNNNFSGELPLGFFTVPNLMYDPGEFDIPCTDFIPVTECSALVNLYYATGGDSWTNNSGWLNGEDPSGWVGVRVIDGGVTEIDLMGNNLTGALPSSIADFTNLTSLNLGDNSLSGELTSKIGRLVNLEVLNLSSNNFSGELPTEIDDFVNLEILWIHNNNFSGELPLGFFTIPNLMYDPGEFDIPCTDFIPLTECKALVDLYNATGGDSWTNNNSWLDDGNPNGWVGVQLLDGGVTEIDLMGNNLTGALPSSIDDFTNLTHLNLGDNSLSGYLPNEIVNLVNLTTLYLDNNNFSGYLPNEISDLVNLELLRFDNNNFSGELPNEIGDLVNLTTLYLDNNSFSGELPTEIGELVNLTALSLGNNNFSGELPTEIGDIVNLTTLYLDNNNFRGELPTEIGDLVNLELLWIHNNNFNGDLPISVFTIPNLMHDREDYSNIPCSGIPLAECKALLDLFNATDGENWAHSRGWLEGGDPNEWDGGVQVLDGKVTEIDLRANNLTGALPSSIRYLTNLTHLNLSDNGLSGALPTEIGELINLTALHLDNNDFSGELPNEISDLVNLELLRLDNNDFSGELPNEISDLVNLELLRLDNNDFSGELPNEISDLVNLELLWIHSNNLSGALPLTIFTIPSLMYDSEDFNFPCSVVPPTECKALIELYNATDGDNWTNNGGWLKGGDPSGWVGVQVLNGQVKEIDLSGNNLTGALPSSINNFTNLTHLNLSDNSLSGDLPAEIGDLVNLELLRFDNNNFNRALPLTIFTIPSIVYNSEDFNFPCSIVPPMECKALVEFYNATDGDNWRRNSGWLKGGDPNGWHGLRTYNGRVTEIHIWNNNLTGVLPSSIGNFTNLNGIILQGNVLSGELPPEIGDLTNLTILALSGNDFSGELPPEIGDLTNLTDLSLYRNNFSGELPPEIGDLVSLASLSLNRNSFSGELPPEIGGLVSLASLSLYENGFSGELPTEIGDLVNLTRLSLESNNFSGDLPTEIGDLANLTHLSLDNNNLSGELPTEIGNLTDLRNLSLSSNSFSGELPPEIGSLTNLTNLNLGGNNLSGELPTEIGNLTNLFWLYLYDNNFTGDLPSQIGNLGRVTQLHLNNNRFSGSLPTEIGNLTNLNTLNLSRNNFSGGLPTEIGNLVNLRVLRLGDNRFSGRLPSGVCDRRADFWILSVDFRNGCP